MKQLTEKEQKLFTLCIVEACLEYAKEEGKTFEDVFVDAILPGNTECDATDVNIICENMKLLRDEGYISGEIELSHTLMDNDLKEESSDVDLAWCEFHDIEITQGGKDYMKNTDLKKAKLVLRYLGEMAKKPEVQKLFWDFAFKLIGKIFGSQV